MHDSDSATPFQEAAQQEPSAEMSQHDPNQGGMSGLSVAALVCSLILCCPVSTFVGVFLGIGGLVQTRGGRRRGRGMAITGIILGLLFTVGWIVGARYFWVLTAQVVVSGPDLVLEAAYDGDPGTARMYFDVNSVPTDAQFEQFVSQATERYGTFRSATINENSNQQPQGQDFIIPFDLVFSGSRMSAEVKFTVNEKQLTESGSMIGISSITIIDEKDGDLVLKGSWPEKSSGSEPAGS